MNTEKKWELFKQATTGAPNNISFDTMNTAKAYSDAFTKEFPLETLEKNTLSNVVSFLLHEGHPIEETVHFLPFILPLEQIQEGTNLHQITLSSLKDKDTLDVKEAIFAALQAKKIPNSTIEFIKNNPNSKEKSLFIIAFSYLISEDKEMFIEHRNVVLQQFQREFQTTNFSLPYEFLVTNNLTLLHTYQTIESAMETNTLLRIAFRIVSQTKPTSLAQLIEKIQTTYTEICDIFASLKEKINKQAEVQHA